MPSAHTKNNLFDPIMLENAMQAPCIDPPGSPPRHHNAAAAAAYGLAAAQGGAACRAHVPDPRGAYGETCLYYLYQAITYQYVARMLDACVCVRQDEAGSVCS